jgi:hypothetical protein
VYRTDFAGGAIKPGKASADDKALIDLCVLRFGRPLALADLCAAGLAPPAQPRSCSSPACSAS